MIELLVVVAIIALLAALLLPALRSAKQSADRARGISNLRQVGIAVNLYATDNNNRLPDDNSWVGASQDLLLPYISSNLLYGTYRNQPCPGMYLINTPDAPYPIIMCNFNIMGGHSNNAIRVHPIRQVKNPATTFIIAHNFGMATWSVSHFDYTFDGTYDWLFYRPYSGKGTPFFFVDGHTEWVIWKGDGLSKWWDPNADAYCGIGGWFGCCLYYGP